MPVRNMPVKPRAGSSPSRSARCSFWEIKRSLADKVPLRLKVVIMRLRYLTDLKALLVKRKVNERIQSAYLMYEILHHLVQKSYLAKLTKQGGAHNCPQDSK